MFEIGSIEVQGKEKPALFLNGDLVTTRVTQREREPRNRITIEDPDKVRLFHAYRIADIPGTRYLRFEKPFDWSSDIRWIVLTRTSSEIIVAVAPNLYEWNKSFSYGQFYDRVKDTLENADPQHFEGVYIHRQTLQVREETFRKSLGFILQFKIKDLHEKPIGDLLAEVEAVCKSIFQEVEAYLLSESKNVLSAFEFPSAVKIACIQYLQYFAQFLTDLGIDATSQISERAGHVLFSVTPSDGDEALGRIREALAVYLNLPASPVEFDDSFPSMRLQQQIENLKHSQTIAGRELKLAQRVIESQDMIISEKSQTIIEKNTTIQQQARIIDLMSPSIMLDSATNKEELEQVYEGVKIGESGKLKEWLGLHLNPVKVLKSVGKNFLGKGENLSILPPEESTALEKS